MRARKGKGQEIRAEANKVQASMKPGPLRGYSLWSWSRRPMGEDPKESSGEVGEGEEK